MRAFILRGGLTGPFSSDRVSRSLHCGVWAGELGKGDLSAPGTEPDSEGALGCLQECVEPGRGTWWRAGGQAQVGENLDDYGRIFDGRQERQGAAAAS